MRLDGPTLFPADRAAADQKLKRVGNLQFVELREGHLRHRADGLTSRVREALWHVDATSTLESM